MRIHSLCLAALAAVSGLAAQDPPIQMPESGVIAANPVPAPGPDVPPPPKLLLNNPPKHGMPEIPLGYSTVPQPDDPPVAVVGELEDVGGDYITFRNTNVKPSGASTSNVCEPDTILADANNGFLVHNWSAARTTDGGANWTRVNPYSRFPASFGGFCCDQVVTRDRNGSAAAWLLQYVRNLSGNTQRIAIADNAGEVGTDAWSRYYDFRASNFGFAANDWLDYPDAAATNEYFYFTSNVFNQASNFTGAVIWRFRIADAVAGGSLPFSFISSPGGSRGASFRLSHGAAGDMFIGSHASNSSFRVIRWIDGGGFQQVERAIAAWSGGLSPAPGPDGRNWTGRADNRISGGYATSDEFGFVWHVNVRTGRPFNYLKRVSFNAADLQVRNERDIWSSTFALAYPAAVTNAWGHVGIVAAIGGPDRFPSSCTLLADDLETFATARIFATSSAGPTANVWGDYLGVDMHPASDQYGTFVGAGFRTGGADSTVTPEFVHFGREAFGPNYVGLVARATPVNVAITSTPDAFGQGGATTPYYRAYATSTVYTVTAPSRAPGHLFLQWATKSVPDTSFVLQPVGQTSFSISIGGIDDLVEARYVPERILTVGSTNPSSGVAISVSPADFDGRANGSSQFTRAYRDGTSVTLTAPATSGCNPFSRWVVNGSARTGNPITVTMSQAITAVAEYTVRTVGSVSALGPGCPGANGQVPVHSVTHGNGACGPTQGTATSYRLANARPNTVGVLWIGNRTDFFGAIRLPWSLAQFGAPLCNLRHNLFASVDFATDASGAARVDVTWPVDRAVIGTPFHTTFLSVDLPANALGVVLSNAMTTAQGGVR